jgi:hypothetical protein
MLEGGELARWRDLAVGAGAFAPVVSRELPLR